ncbi:MAG: OmpH family outer membrane protein [Bacteroidia bacterium]|nr:OmpH family outer membrane protein [Bacteroidia bacterium]
MNNRTIILTAVLINLIAVSILAWYVIKNQEKTGFINPQKVFEQFEYRSELESALKETLMVHSRNLDSLKNQIQYILSKNEESYFGLNNEEVMLKKQYYAEQILKFDNLKKELQEDFSNKIRIQSNQYLQEFARENGYTYVYSLNDGLLLYGDEIKDLTESVITFINKKYNGR